METSLRELARLSFWLCLSVVVAHTSVCAQSRPPVKITSNSPGFTGLDGGDRFGEAVATIGDLDGDGVVDLAVGAPGDDDGRGSHNRGAIWILFLNSDGTVKSYQKISEEEAGSGELIHGHQRLGQLLLGLPDLDGNGGQELLAGSKEAFVPPRPRPALLTLFLAETGIPLQHVGSLTPNSTFTAGARAAGNIGDLDGDGVDEFAVKWNSGSEPAFVFSRLSNQGALSYFSDVWSSNSLFRDQADDLLGYSFGILPDFDRNGIHDIAIGAPTDLAETVWVMSVDFEISSLGRRQPKPVAARQVGPSRTGKHAKPGFEDRFGRSLLNLGDLDGDGIPELAVGAPGDDEGGLDRGAVWILFLDEDGEVRAETKINSEFGPMRGLLSDEDQFGFSLTSLGDLDEDGTVDIAIGAPSNGSELAGPGAVWIYFGLPALPPTIEIDTDPSASDVGRAVRIASLIRTAGSQAVPELTFTRGGDPTFLTVEMRGLGDGRFEAIIPAFAVTERGIEYFVTATNTAGVESRYPVTGSVFLPVRVSDGLNRAAVGGETVAAYRLFSVPLDLDTKSVRAVLEDDLGPYNPQDWRLFGLGANQRAIELSEQDFELTPGSAYWLITRERGRLITTGPGVSIASNAVIEIDLVRGWNLVGNPFAFPVSSSEITTESGAKPEMFAFSRGWAAADTLMPWSGVAIHSMDDDILLIEPGAERNPDGNESAIASSPERRMQLDALFPFLGDETESPDLNFDLQIYPNPITTRATIELYLRRDSRLTVSVFDVLGRRVLTLADDREYHAGRHELIWDGQDGRGRLIPGGTYFVRSTILGSHASRKVILAK